MTPAQAKKRFEDSGTNVTKWAKEKGLNPRTVVAVLNGFNKGRRGHAHEVAVALGIKAGA